MPHTPPQQRNISPTQQVAYARQRASSALPTFPYVPGSYIPQPFTRITNHFGQVPAHPLPLPPPTPAQQPFIEPYRIPLPLNPQLPYIIDPSSLQMAANHDPNQMYDSIQALVEERDELKKANNKLRAENATLKAERNTLELENKGLGESWESTKLDYRVARDKLDKMEYICGLQSAKQVILWKFIERLQNGETGPPIGEDGFWRLRKAPMAPVSEASEPSSDQSYASTVGSKDSSETKLDPHAQAFVPQSPAQPLGPNAQILSTPTKPVASAEPEKVDEEATPTNEAAAFIELQVKPADKAAKEAIVKLPSLYFGVCPNSLSTPGPCPLIHCRLQPLCEDFNDENGPGCSNLRCIQAHIYRSCTEMLDGVECSYMQITDKSTKKKAHFVKRVHPVGLNPVTKKDWQMRIAIAGLREAHKDQRY